jgi:hypothetical protein
VIRRKHAKVGRAPPHAPHRRVGGLLEPVDRIGDDEFLGLNVAGRARMLDVDRPVECIRACCSVSTIATRPSRDSQAAADAPAMPARLR